ncbi:MAG: DNA-processing protein DprA [Planctomycetota bacterium]
MSAFSSSDSTIFSSDSAIHDGPNPPLASDQTAPLETVPRLRSLLQLALLPGIGPRTLSSLIARFGDPDHVLQATQHELSEVHGVGPRIVHTIQTATDHVDVPSVMDHCLRTGVSILTQESEEYPKALKDLVDAPPLLFAKGGWLLRDSFAVAIVGTRHATTYGLKQTERIVNELVGMGVTIVSGLARGIDSASHRAALNAGGRTLAVIGGGMAEMYPPENAPLAEEIAQSGVVFSEQSPFSKPKSHMFPQRNRLIAAMSLATVVIEAPQRSGSMITARLAGEMGRDVMALPGPVSSRASRGCHELIRDGAVLVQTGQDILELIGSVPEPIANPLRTSATQGEGSDTGPAVNEEDELRDAREATLNSLELQILRVIGPDAIMIDEVVQRSGLPTSRVGAVISILEVKRFIRRVGGQMVVRI